MVERVAPYAQAHAGFRLEDQEAMLSARLKGGLNACAKIQRFLLRNQEKAAADDKA